MKKIFTIIFIATLTTSCSKQNATPTISVYETVDSTNATLSFKGDFINGPYGVVKGMVSVYVDSVNYVLTLKDFEASNGPDLHVYLSQEEQPIHFIDLGKLKSIRGNQLYNVPVDTDFMLYKYALIHCQQYNHLFGSSILEEE